MLFDASDVLTDLCSLKIPPTILHYIPAIQQNVSPSDIRNALLILGHEAQEDAVHNLTHVLTLKPKDQYAVLGRLVKDGRFTEAQACARAGSLKQYFPVVSFIRLNLDRAPNLHRLTPLYETLKEREHVLGFQECFVLVLAVAELLDICTYVHCVPHTTYSVLMELGERLHNSIPGLVQANAAKAILDHKMWHLYGCMKLQPLSVEQTYKILQFHDLKCSSPLLPVGHSARYPNVAALEELLQLPRLSEAFRDDGVMY